MKKLLLSLAILFVTACGAVDDESLADGSDEAADEADVGKKEEALWCFGFPYMTMAFPTDQGAWKGSGAGQIMYALFGNTGPSCPPVGTEIAYGQDDGQINLIQSVGWAPNTCYKATNSIVVCNGQSFPCPATACLTLPSMWQMSKNAPGNEQVWDWVNPSYSASPGRHGIWPAQQNTCASGPATAQFNPNGSGGTTLACTYPMGMFNLHQF